MKTYEMEQGSPEWFAIRLGKVTASNFHIAKAGGQGKTRLKLIYKLLAERLTGEPQETYKNAAMERGNDVEPMARDYYANLYGVDVREVGFVELNEDIGASPDGLVDTDGEIEIKCPNSATHIEYIINDKLPAEHRWQVHGQLWVTDRQWCDFISFDPRVESRPIFVKRVERDDKFINGELCEKIYAFVDELKKLEEKLTAAPF